MPRRAMELDLDITYILVLALFLVPVLLLNALVFRPFLRLFEERHDKLEGAVERAHQMIGEAEERADAFKKQIREASRQGEERRNAIRKEARERMESRIEDEKKLLQEKLSGALADLETKRKDALSKIEVEADRLAEQTASKLLGRSL